MFPVPVESPQNIAKSISNSAHLIQPPGGGRVSLEWGPKKFHVRRRKFRNTQKWTASEKSSPRSIDHCCEAFHWSQNPECPSVCTSLCIVRLGSTSHCCSTTGTLPPVHFEQNSPGTLETLKDIHDNVDNSSPGDLNSLHEVDSFNKSHSPSLRAFCGQRSLFCRCVASRVFIVLKTIKFRLTIIRTTNTYMRHTLLYRLFIPSLLT